jgi:hypothetical protein
MTKVLHLARAPKAPSQSSDQSDKILSLKKSLDGAMSEIEQLKSKLQDSIKSRDRLKSVYHSTTQGFKQAYRKITGFSIDAIESNRFSVQSIYLEGVDEYLIFETKNNRNHEIDKIRFSRSKSKSQSGVLEKYMDALVEKNEDTDHFPMIMAQIALELWQIRFSDN